MYSQLTTLSAYSLLQSTIKIPHYIEQAKKMGYQTLGLTDHNVLYGAVEFYQQCLAQGIKPILALCSTVPSGRDQCPFHCTYLQKTSRAIKP